MIDTISKVVEIAGCDLASTLPPDGDPLQTIVPPQLHENTNAHDHFATYDSAGAEGQTPEIAAETTAICERFAGGFSQNQPPKIEEYLPAHIVGLARTVLVERLVLIELAELRKSNQRIDTTKYLSRFPNEQAALQSAFRNFDRLSIAIDTT